MVYYMNTKIKVVDDFLPKKNFKNIQDVMLSPDFPWYYNSVIDRLDDEDKFQFQHYFYRNNRPLSSFYNEWYDMLVMPIVDWSVLDRIKANLLTRTPEIIENEFHTDINPPTKPLTTSIFYVNTNNGYTKFEDGTRVESVENRLLTFPMNMKHTGTTCTDEKIRVVINLLYMKYDETS